MPACQLDLHKGCSGAAVLSLCAHQAVANMQVPTYDASWYKAITKPKWTPPNWVFPAVWIPLKLAQSVSRQRKRLTTAQDCKQMGCTPPPSDRHKPEGSTAGSSDSSDVAVFPTTQQRSASISSSAGCSWCWQDSASSLYQHTHV